MTDFSEKASSFEPQTVLLVGAGVIGRSLALAYAQNFPNFEICLYDRDPQICAA